MERECPRGSEGRGNEGRREGGRERERERGGRREEGGREITGNGGAERDIREYGCFSMSLVFVLEYW